jgi:hypothetical protein
MVHCREAEAVNFTPETVSFGAAPTPPPMHRAQLLLAPVGAGKVLPILRSGGALPHLRGGHRMTPSPHPAASRFGDDAPQSYTVPTDHMSTAQ